MKSADGRIDQGTQGGLLMRILAKQDRRRCGPYQIVPIDNAPVHLLLGRVVQEPRGRVILNEAHDDLAFLP